ncbi:MAG TPA: cupredoxin domain-containing protein [Candidatus Polarisedimenticolia bacterium]|jgi:heme/copper-type cytochrome/quinol oxidase subunit 2|nr:cupredoxin domain-containing protein [Candidatus Polarisedimenticolia bacterium]
MKPTLRSVLALLCVSFGLGGAAATPSPGRSPQAKPASVTRPASKVKNITIVAIEGKLSPDVIRVRRGDLVRLTFKVKDGTYGVKIPALNVKGKATPERPVYVEFAATSEGEYEIRCTKFWGIKHWSENGKIVVE